MKYSIRNIAKRWIALALCLCVIFPSGTFYAFAENEPASPSETSTEPAGEVSTNETALQALEVPARAPRALAAEPKAGETYDLADEAFQLKGTLTVDGKEPDENTVIEDGTPFNVRLAWEFPAGVQYTAVDTFTYTLPETISVSDREGDISRANGEKIGTYKIEKGKVSIQYIQSFLDEQDRNAWLNINGEFDLDESATSPDGTITIVLPGGVTHTITVKGDGGLQIEKTAEKRVDNENHRVYIDYVLTVTAVKRNTNVTIQDTISAAMGSVPKNDKILNWTLTNVEGKDGCTVEQDFFTISDDKRTASGTIAEMPAGSNVTIQYTIEVDSTGILADTETKYTNTATASSDQNEEVSASESVDILPTAIGKIGNLSGDKKTVYWTIQVKLGEFESVNVQEQLDVRTQTVENDTEVKIYYGYPGNNNEPVYTATFGDFWADGYELKKVADKEKSGLYSLVFAATVQEGVTATGLENIAMIQAPELEAKGYVSLQPANLWKTFVGHDIGKNTVTWKTTFILPEHQDSVTFTDEIMENKEANKELKHRLLQDGVKLELVDVDNNTREDITKDAKIELSDEGSLLTVTLQNAAAGRYELTCTTTYTLPTEENTQGARRLENHACYSVLEGRYVSAQRDIPLNYIQKDAASVAGDTVVWNVSFTDDIASSYGPVTVTDTLPQRLEFVSATFQGEEIEPTGNENGKLSFSLSNVRQNDQLVITTKVIDYRKLQTSTEYKNVAQLTIDEAAYPQVSATATVPPPEVATKEQDYTQGDRPIVHYTISINPESLDLIPEEQTDQTFTLTDTIGSALRFEEDTLRVNGSPWAGEVTFQGNTMKIHGMQDETSYEITYDARIVLDSGTDFGGEGWNKVDVSPIEIPQENQSSTELTGQVMEATAGGESDTLEVSILKTDDAGAPLAGAEFTLYAYGTGSEPSGEGTPVEGGTLTSGQNGETAPVEVAFDTIYRFVETGVPEGYAKGDDLPYFVRPSKGNTAQYGEDIKVLTGYQEYQFTAVNPKVNTPEVIDIPVTKVWDDADDQDGKRPDEITIRLYADGQPLKDKVATLNAANGWKYTFKGLPKHEAGNEIVYTIMEDAVSGYSATVDNTTFTVTNRYTPGKTSVSVTKSWDDNAYQDGMRPAAVEIKLLADGADTGKTLRLSAENNWAGTFGNLDEYKAGKKIAYSIQEVGVHGYETSISGNAAEGYVVTNRHVPERVEVSGRKIWRDAANQSLRPDCITIRLLANERAIAKILVTAGDDWQWTFTDLPKYENGKQIVYSISEDKVEGYTTTIDGYNVINTSEWAGLAGSPSAAIPQTSDDMPVGLLGGLAALAASGLAALLALRKRRGAR